MPRFDLNDYVTVQERIVQFWAEHKEGAIRTQLESPSDNFNACRYSASVYAHRDDALPAATGWAFEVAGATGPNATSHEENCETSAIGRALANLGYATSQRDRPSREEMTKVASAPAHDRSDQFDDRMMPRQQEVPRPQHGNASEKQVNAIHAMNRRLGNAAIPDFELQKLTRADASAMIEQMQAQLDGSRPLAPA